MAEFRIAYLSTNYPSMSHTFIQTEVLGLALAGVDVIPMALNAARENDLLSETDRREAARTTYIKATPKRVIASAVLRALVTHPAGLASTAARLLRPHIGNWPRLWKRSLQVLEALIVSDECRRRDVHAIHAHMGLASATVAWYASELTRGFGRRPLTWSMTVHGWSEFVDDGDADLHRKVAAASLVVCISDFTKSQVMRVSDPADWHKLRVVRCGVDLAGFPRRSDSATVDRRSIVMTARLAPEKGHLVLVEAIASLAARGVDCSARLVGAGPFAEPIAAAIDAHGLGDRIVLVGPLAPADVAHELARAGVFCLPSFAEGLPVVLMEAMAVGVPVVTTAISGIPELVRDGETGFVVPASRADLLADALERALTCDDAALATVVADARLAVEARHDARTTVAVLARALRDAHLDERPTAAVAGGRFAPPGSGQGTSVPTRAATDSHAPAPEAVS